MVQRTVTLDGVGKNYSGVFAVSVPVQWLGFTNAISFTAEGLMIFWGLDFNAWALMS